MWHANMNNIDNTKPSSAKDSCFNLVFDGDVSNSNSRLCLKQDCYYLDNFFFLFAKLDSVWEY